jgi:hypothetical protein
VLLVTQATLHYLRQRSQLVKIAGVTTPAAVGWSSDGGTARFLNGYIDDLRITKGAARYTGNFTPPTAALPLN